MNVNNEPIEEFECILKQRPRITSAIYDNHKQSNKGDFRYKCTARDIITSVSTQIISMQKADALGYVKNATHKFKINKKLESLNNYMSENKGVSILIKNPTNKFETQCVSNTQLINLVKDVEKEDTEYHTNEIQDIFCSQDDISSFNTKTDSNKKIHCSLTQKDGSIKLMCSEKYLDNSQESKTVSPILLNTDFERFGCVTKKRNNLDLLISTQENFDLTQDPRAISPIINCSTHKRNITPSPLIVDLANFEYFEKIAVPIVEKNASQTDTKRLIDLQLLDKEFNIHGCNEGKCNSNTFSKNLEENHTSVTVSNYVKNKEEVKENTKCKLSEFLNDEILFSSDEDHEYIHREVQDLPFTCALETSFYNESHILDKKMYVGFQTASNKSIQICSDSFSKANALLSGVKEETDNTLTINDLVKKYDQSMHKNISDKVTTIEETEDNEFKENVNESIILKNSDKNKHKLKCLDFKTVSNKNIKLSDQAIARVNKVFLNIDLEDTFDLHNNIEKLISEKSESSQILLNNNLIKKINDDYIVNEFENDMEVMEDSNTKSFCGDFVGFRTASNKNIKISEVALNKSKKIFEDINNPKMTESYNTLNTEGAMDNQVKNPSEGNFLFADVSNSPKKMNEVIPTYTLKECDNPTINKDIFFATNFQGFKTAHNKEIKISEEAITKTRNIFKDIHQNETAAEGNFRNVSMNINCESFGFKTVFKKDVPPNEPKTAIKRPLSVPSDAVLNKEKELHLDLVNEVLVDDVRKPCFVSNLGLKGFQTASNKPVIISGEALEKSKKIFKDLECSDLKTTGKLCSTNEDVDVSSLCHMRSGISCVGFQTASKKPVKISEEALSKTKDIFKNLDPNPFSNDHQKTICNEDITSFHFKTANRTIINNQIEGDLNKAISQDISVGQMKHTIIPEKSDICGIILECDIDTQIVNNFNETLNTEDFSKDMTKSRKRSTSPILFCPRAKKRKFETPLRKNTTFEPVTFDVLVNNNKPVNIDSLNNNYKINKQYNLKSLHDLESMKKSKDKDNYLFEFDFESLMEFKFIGKRNDVSHLELTIEDVKTMFVANVNRKIIPDGWLDNHIKLILWKLISYEIRFPAIMKHVCSAKNLLEQLVYRYKREIYNVERPVLRKILEKDDISTRTMILCIVGILQDGFKVTSVTSPKNIELLVTDGWYCIKATIDKMLMGFVCENKIRVGCKIATHGAELLNCEQGVSPWEDTSSVRLKLFGNSTRPARWDARLGCLGNGAIMNKLSAVKPDGGKVSKLRVLVTRVYPPLYVEKFDDGSTVTRSERLETIHQMKHEAERQLLMEKLYEEVEKEFLGQYSQSSSDLSDCCDKRASLDSGSQIAKMMKRNKETEFKTLTTSQNVLLEEYTSKRREKILHEMQKSFQKKLEDKGLNVGRNVVSVLKVRVAGLEEKMGNTEVSRGMLSIWKPTDPVLEIIKEGNWIEAMNVFPTAIRYSELQLSAGRQSIFKAAKRKVNDKERPYTTNLARTCYPIKDLCKNPTTSTEYNEIDTTGMIFQIEPSITDFNPSVNQFQNVYLTDADKNFVCVNFWGGVKKYGFDIILDTGQIVTCVNLQKRTGNNRKNIPQYRATEYTYFTKTPKNDSARKFNEDLEKKLYGLDRRKYCNDCIVLKSSLTSFKYKDSENVSPYRFNNTDYNISRNKMFIESPLAQRNVKQDDFNLTGLDFESSFKQSETQDLSPAALLRKKTLNEKIAMLKRYGEPPPLCRIQINNKSKRASNSFRSPILLKSSVNANLQSDTIKKTPGHLEGTHETKNTKIATDDTKEEQRVSNLRTSPILNSTYIKRCVNPVKLNFSSVANDENNAVNHFEEHFEFSPPLSLDSSDCL